MLSGSVIYQSTGKRIPHGWDASLSKLLGISAALPETLAILACGFLFHDKDSTLLSGDPHTRIEMARRVCTYGAVFRKRPVGEKAGSIRRTLPSAKKSFRSWWMRRSGSAAIFKSPCLLSWNILIWCGRAMLTLLRTWMLNLTGSGVIRSASSRYRPCPLPQMGHGRCDLTMWSPMHWSWTRCVRWKCICQWS